MGQYPYFKTRRPPQFAVLPALLAILVLAGFFPASPAASSHETTAAWPQPVPLDILVDRQGHWTIDDVAGPGLADSFMPSRSASVNLGFSRAPRWVRFKLASNNEDSRGYLLEVGFPLIDQVDLYLPTADGGFMLKKGGESIPVSRREVRDRNPVFRIELAGLAASTCYLRYQDNGSVPFCLRLWEENAFNREARARQYLQGLFYGAMLIMICHNLIIYFAVRSRSYLYYVTYVACYLLWQTLYNGLANEYLWPDLPSFSNRLLPFLICACGLAAAQFTRSFLETKGVAPLLDSVLRLVMLVFIIVFLVSLQPNHTASIVLAALIMTLLAPLLLFTGVYCWRKGRRPARYFTVAWFVLLCGATALGLKSFGLLPSNFITENSIQLGSLLEIILLSLALADRVKIMKLEQEEARQEVLRVQQQATARLETQVQARTLALQASKQELEILSSKLAKYLSPQLYRSIFSGKTEVKVQSQRRKLTVFFSDIVGFTEMTDNMESETLTMLLNEYLNEMAGIAINYGGTIDKYIGDAIMVFFGDPESRGEQQDALACVEMALAMRQRLQELQAGWKTFLPKPLTIRMGINTGYCTVGNLGSDNRLDYTIIGGPVNLASRLESRAAPGQILISYNTYALVEGRIACATLGEIQVKGMAYPVRTYQVLDLYGRLRPAGRDEINLTGEGYSIRLDFSNMPADSEKKVAALLKGVLEEL